MTKEGAKSEVGCWRLEVRSAVGEERMAVSG